MFQNIPSSIDVWMSHADRIDTMPNDWEVTSQSTNGIISSIQNINNNIFGVQFHPEVIHTEQGKVIGISQSI